MTTVAREEREPAPQSAREGGNGTRRRLGEVLVDAGVLDEGQLAAVLAECHRPDGPKERLGQVVARLGLATDAEIARALAEQLGLAFTEDPGTAADPTVAAAVPEALARRHGVMALAWDAGKLVLACTDPTDVVAIDDVRLAAGVSDVERVVTTPAVVAAMQHHAYGNGTDELLEAVDADEEEAEEQGVPAAVEEAPVVRLASRLLQDAISVGASDVHFQPGRDGTVVRYRIDGVLHRATVVPRSASPALLSRLKIMAQMDIAERRLPQDGRMRLRSPSGAVDLRASTLPSLHGETLVLRLLRQDDQRLALADIGLDDEQRAAARAAIERPQGLLLVAGPTGSGKTSTLYALLHELADDARKIVTLEDPIEYELGGVSQSQIDARIGLTFPRSLRTVLRQDPDVIMVGEIRDPETAELALQASLTGHLVLSTIHANDAPGAVDRLRDLSIPAYLIASALTAVIAQRLARRLCPACSRPATPSERERGGVHPDGEQAFRMPVGCGRCGQTGYSGRTGLFEVLPIEGAVREMIAVQEPAAILRRSSRAEGVSSLRNHGLAKARRGTTSLPEVLRVSPSDHDASAACPACTQTIEPAFAHCPWCGQDLQPPACAECGRDLRPDWRVCPACGSAAASAAADPAPRADGATGLAERHVGQGEASEPLPAQRAAR